MSAIHQHRNRPNSHQSAPGPLTHQRTKLRLLEQPRQRIAARARKFIRDHHLRPIDARVRRVLDLPVPRRPVRFDVPPQHFNEIVGHLPARVEPLINHRSLLVSLRKVVAIEIRESALARVRQIYIRQLAA